MNGSIGWRLGWIVCAASLWPAALVGQESAGQVKDLSLLVSPRYPCFWPVGMTQHLVIPSRTIGPGAYHRDLVIIDEHTGTQWDAPAHFTPPPDSGIAGAGAMGLITGDKVPAWQFVGEACVIDVRKHCDEAEPGCSFLITPEIVQTWEKDHRPIGPGDVVLFRGDYSDRYYLPLNKGGERFVQSPLQKKSPGWPGPTPQCMKYLGEKKVAALGIDSASMGPLPDLAAATHQAGAQYGMIWTECATNLGSLPTTGAAYVLLAAKHAGGSGGEARAIGITNEKLAARLIQSAKAKKVLDVSVLLDEDLPITWPGYAAGEEASRYVAKTLNAFQKSRGPYFARTHMLDALAGTHVVPRSFTAPPEGSAALSPEIQTWIAHFQQEKVAGRKPEDETADKIPLEALMGEARVIDVRGLIGTTKESQWPASPQITLATIQAYEKQTRPIAKGDVVLFRSGYSDQHFRAVPAAPEQDRLMAAPLAGKAEGWPAPNVEVITHLAEKGVRCIGTDGPTLGGVDKKQALFVYWAAAALGVYPVEFLTNLDKVPQENAYFIFAPIKMEYSHGGYGRALVLH